MQTPCDFLLSHKGNEEWRGMPATARRDNNTSGTLRFSSVSLDIEAQGSPAALGQDCCEWVPLIC